MNSDFNVKAVIFDLGRVMIGVDLKKGLFSRLPEKSKEDDASLMEELFSNDLFLSFSAGKITPHEFHTGFCDMLNFQMSYETFITEWCDIFYPIDGMDRLFYEVIEKYPVGILSDIDPLHWKTVREMLPFLNKIPHPVLSFEQGVLKPHPDIYKAAAESVNVPAGNCLFIDDRPINVSGAKKAGMQAVQFFSAQHLRNHLKNRNIL